jgi:hypothetical protein
MPAIDDGPYLADAVQNAVSTNAASASPIATVKRPAVDSRLSWDEVERQLITWGCEGHPCDEEDIDPPSKTTLKLAIQIADKLAREGGPGPTSVVADVNGGIVFELLSPKTRESIHIHDGGKIEHIVLRNHRIVLREEWLNPSV